MNTTSKVVLKVKTKVVVPAVKETRLLVITFKVIKAVLKTKAIMVISAASLLAIANAITKAGLKEKIKVVVHEAKALPRAIIRSVMINAVLKTRMKIMIASLVSGATMKIKMVHSAQNAAETRF